MIIENFSVNKTFGLWRDSSEKLEILQCACPSVRM